MTSTSIYQSTKTLPYVYRLDHPETGEFYIGYREANKKPSNIDLPLYKTSSKAVKPRFGEFKWHIVAEFFDAESALKFEQQLIFENWNNPLILNENCRAFGKAFRNSRGLINPSKETREKISRANKLRVIKPETIEKCRAASTGMNNPRYGVKLSEELKLRLSISQLGKPKPQQKATCPHCNKVGALNNMKRYHFENCKFKL
jgi:hypothetical protein